jgi:hypothetical protein
LIKIKLATKQPIEDDNHWSYPFSELDYLLEKEDGDATFLLYDRRLYETDEESDLQKLREAKRVICTHCDYDGCEWCQVERVISNVKQEVIQ